MTKSQLIEFLAARPLAVISTIHPDGRPESAVIGIGESPDAEIIFNTRTSSRKYANLQASSAVALVIGWDKTQTVQVEGEAIQLSGDDLAAYKEMFLVKNTYARNWADNPEIAFFKVKLTWARFTDIGQQPWQIEDIQL